MERFLDGKVALITGTAGGQGRLAAMRFAAAGAHVIGCDVDPDGNIETARLIEKAGGRFSGQQPVDLGDNRLAREWVDSAGTLAGQIDILYNNASAARFTPFEDFSFEDWEWTIRNELHIVFNTTNAAWPWLRRQGGVIINIASIAGMIGAEPGGAGHAAAKGAVIALSKQLAVEGAPDGIRVVTISPGLIETPGTAPLLANADVAASLLGYNLIKRVGQPNDVVSLALFLASDDAGFITGTNIVVDGGRIAW